MKELTTKLDYALAYADLGWLVFPCFQITKDGKCACGSECKSPGKHPISVLAPRGQDSATDDKTVITEWFTSHPEANIAVYLAGSGLCAIDIDPRNGGDYTMEDLENEHGELVADVVQLTGGAGEHRLFLRPDGTLPGKLGKGVDVKLNGYIIAEPSNHISGGQYIWEASSCPLDGAVAGPLPDWIRSFSTSQAADSNSDVAINFGMDDGQYYDVLEALQFISSDDRDTWLRVGMCLFTSNDKRAYEMWCNWSAGSDKYDHDDQYRVWRSFRHKGLDSVDVPTIFHMAQDNGWINTKKGSGPVIDIDDMEDDDNNLLLPKRKSNNKVPDHLLSFPVPILNDIGEWMEGFSREPQPQITMMGVLGLASVICGRMYCSTEANTSSLYMMVLGDTGIGKNYVKNGIQQFLSQANLTELLGNAGSTSSGAVFTQLVKKPCHIQIIDEIGKQLQTARKQSNGMMAEAFSTLVECYSSTTDMIIPKGYSNMGAVSNGTAKTMEDIIIHNPAISLLGLATPAQVYENLSTTEIEDGFLNRLIVADITEPQAPKQRTKRLPVPDHVIDWANTIRHPVSASKTSLGGIDTGYQLAPNQITVEFDDEALDLFDAYQDDLKAREGRGEFVLPDLTRRWTENAMKVATCLAVCANPVAPIITVELAIWSLEFVEHYGREFMLNTATKVADSDFHRLYLAVLDFITRAGSKGMSERKLSQNCRLYASTPPTQRDAAMMALDREGRIRQFSFKPTSGRGRPRTIWIAEEFITDDLVSGVSA